MKRRVALAALVFGCAAFGCRSSAPDGGAGEAAAPGPDDAALVDAGSRDDQWLTYGRTYAEDRFSPLALIDEHNVGKLGLAWSYETGTRRGMEGTPLYHDGVLYATGSFSIAFAVDARSGRELWRYDPQVPGAAAANACCDVVNRGPALYRGRLYFGTLDGRLIALDAKSGRLVWEVRTTDPSLPYTITGAPRVVKGRVIIGNGGAELGVRGYVSAYDAVTGALAWRFYTVPGDPSLPLESPALAKALPTWKGGEWWKVGGGGTVWDSLVYDPELDLLYVGTGNGGPWIQRVRSPGGGDNLFLSSILALRPDTGELVWHYQTTPGDVWDYTATQPMILADLELGGRTRKVLMQAPKNGFFYVLDRETGELLSAEKYVPVTWAERVDPATGRPVEAPGARYGKEPKLLHPGPAGGHGWHPMSYDPKTGLVYIPTLEMPYAFAEDAKFSFQRGHFSTGSDSVKGAMSMVDSHSVSALIAWDPVRQKRVWRVEHPYLVNGGVLSTAGNLVFQGTGRGTFAAYRATDGEKLFEAFAGTGVVAPPITYRLDGEQYVAVLAGLGGGIALATADPPPAVVASGNAGRLLVWKLGGSAQLPNPPLVVLPVEPIEVELDPAQVEAGKELFFRYCSACHGPGAIGGGTVPDLRRSQPAVYGALPSIVLEGGRIHRGMPSFGSFLGPTDAEALRAYLLSRRAELVAEERAAR